MKESEYSGSFFLCNLTKIIFVQNYILTFERPAHGSTRPNSPLYHMIQNLSIGKLHKFLPQNFPKFSNRHIAQKIRRIFVQYYHLHFCSTHGILNISNEREINEMKTDYEILLWLLKSQKLVYNVAQIECTTMICLTFHFGKVIFNRFKMIEKIIENAWQISQ